jgi:predicted nucleotidyltransferase
MDMYKLKWTRLQEEIFTLLSAKSGEKLNQREISKLLKVSPTAIGNALVELEKEKIIIIERQGKINLSLVFLNRESSEVIFMKRIENIRMIYQSGLYDKLFNSFPGTTIFLFGSYSQGGDVIKSDIDIAIIGNKERNINLEEYEKLLEREINVEFYDSWKIIPKNLKNNILNGVILSGSVDL